MGAMIDSDYYVSWGLIVQCLEHIIPNSKHLVEKRPSIVHNTKPWRLSTCTRSITRAQVLPHQGSSPWLYDPLRRAPAHRHLSCFASRVHRICSLNHKMAQIQEAPEIHQDLKTLPAPSSWLSFEMSRTSSYFSCQTPFVCRLWGLSVPSCHVRGQRQDSTIYYSLFEQCFCYQWNERLKALTALALYAKLVNLQRLIHHNYSFLKV